MPTIAESAPVAVAAESTAQRRFRWFAWGVLAYNILVILWGAYVRATGSGAGCGDHWPLCNGEVVPVAPQAKTIIEFFHRATSGFSGLLIIGLFFLARRLYPVGHAIRRGANWSLILVIVEGLLGAGLVKLGLTAANQSGGRAVAIALHLMNTLLLVAALTLTAWWASNNSRLRWRSHGVAASLLGIALIGTMFLAAAGAITALGDTLFPPATLQAGLNADINPAAHFLVRLRVIHPIMAVIMGCYLTLVVSMLLNLQPTRQARRYGWLVAGLVVVQFITGAMNIWLLAPVWTQMVHLLLADLVWICLVLFTASVIREPAPHAAAR